MRQCVERRNATAPAVQLEASGGVTLDSIAAIAATGVERISVGAITHSAPALDIALDYRV
jgi:nicotinate-nucleotide pyrophosphorylase (carboxylating)